MNRYPKVCLWKILWKLSSGELKLCSEIAESSKGLLLSCAIEKKFSRREDED
jgi:hypothetical protein